MKNTLKFNSQFKVLDGELSNYSEDIIKNEPMFFRASYDFCQQHAGPITAEFLKALPQAWKTDTLCIDSRVHMLMPGWFPCIPGYHHDDVVRSRSDGQPNYHDTNNCQHIFALINGHLAPTKFAIGQIELEEPQHGQIIYKHWHQNIVDAINTGQLAEVSAPSNKLIEFDYQAFHTGTRAVENGWRWFIRATRYASYPPQNEIRRQVQVYLEFPTEGW